ncbi:MAG: hypothetical protein L3J58_11730 [Emcibacter sp.]|nr:hypothetical protein [Emcibacter sp.]
MNDNARLLAELRRSDNDVNRRCGVTVKKTWQFADDPDKGSRTIYVTINRATCGGKICQVLVSGTSAHAKSGSMLQNQFDLATFFITRLIQHGEDPREMLECLVPVKSNPNSVITAPTILEVAVLEAIVKEMDNG